MADEQNSAASCGSRKQRAWSLIAVGGLLAVVPLLRRSATGRLRWYRPAYWLAYRFGLIVWQRPTPSPELVALVEGPSSLGPGRALDLGCGTGTDTVYLARHGWEVTAVDMVPKALASARRRAVGAGVAPRFVLGDVTRLREIGVGNGYTLLLDFGCFHTLPDDRRPAYVASVSSAAARDGMLLLYGFRRPPKVAPMHAGVTAEEVERRFGPAGWQLVNAELSSAETMAATRADIRSEMWCYQLQSAST